MHRLSFLLAFLVVGCTPLAARRVPGLPDRTVQSNQEPDANVNSRYTVESVDVHGRHAGRLSTALRAELDRLVGAKLDHAMLDKLSKRIRKELRVHMVAVNVGKGSAPGQVAVAFEAERRRTVGFDVDAAKLAYHSQQGWSGIADLSLRIKETDFAFGLANDGDSLTERFAGIRARWERKEMISDRVGLRFDYSNYRAQWSPATLQAMTATSGHGLNETGSGLPGIYRTRESFAPVLTVALAKPLSLSAGVDFVRLQTQYPAARHESANVAVTTLRYAQRWGDSGKDPADLRASYSLRAASRSLDTDYVYARHGVNARFVWSRFKHKVTAAFEGGLLNGRAPFFERFTSGNTQTLRGWNKFDLAPRGGERLAAGSLEYRYGVFSVFWDTGAVWDRGAPASQKHSLGAGIRLDGFQMAVAFPVREGRMTPVFMVGTTF